MAFHPRSENPAYDTTVWDQLQQKHGNLPDAELGSDRLRAAEAAERAALEELEAEQAAQADAEWEETALSGDQDGVDEEDAKFMQEYREKRLAELAAQAKRARFGSVVDISPDGFRQEVTDVADDDLRVVVHLYADNTPECRVVDQLLQLLAGKHPCTKFAVLSRPHLISCHPAWKSPGESSLGLGGQTVVGLQ
ncbi:MAG: hypothetical protein ACPIOQ_08410 [Promethearchaeia archaeon]